MSNNNSNEILLFVGDAMKIVDMHCDTVSILLKERRAGEHVSLRENKLHLDLKRMKKSGYLLQNFALYVDKEKCEDTWEEVCALYKVYKEELVANSDMISPVLKYSDIGTNESLDKLSALLTVEEGAVCKGKIEKLRKLYDMGVRMMTLTWNYPNELGFPNVSSNRDNFSTEGLTECGREFVTEMECLGMIIDVSHLSDAGFYDIIESTHKPFVASHSNARSICHHARNLTDDMIRKLAERGGCIGLNYYEDFLEDNPAHVQHPGNIASIVRHAKHIVKVGGIEVLGLGSDFDGIDTNKELPGVQSIGILSDALAKAGFTQSELDKLFFENVLRVYRDCLV